MYGPLLEIEWILIIHNNDIFPYYGYSMKVAWIYYGFSDAIANFIVWISHFFPRESYFSAFPVLTPLGKTSFISIFI